MLVTITECRTQLAAGFKVVGSHGNSLAESDLGDSEVALPVRLQAATAGLHCLRITIHRQSSSPVSDGRADLRSGRLSSVRQPCEAGLILFSGLPRAHPASRPTPE